MPAAATEGATTQAELSGSDDEHRAGLPGDLIDHLASERRWSERPVRQTEISGEAPRNQLDDKSEEPKFFLLPEHRGRNADREFADEPPLPIELSSGEIRELQDERIVVATHFGPKVQEKASNEDFALGGVLQLGRRGEFGFAAIADGVSTRTFWAARTARIACLTTYKVVRRLLEDGLDLGQPQTISHITVAIAQEIETCLKADAHRLETAGTIPAGWNPATYQKYKSDRTMWYRSTLLFGVAGERGSVIGYAGDGGIRTFVMPERATSGPIEKCVLQADDGGLLSNYVSLAFKPEEITAGHFLHDGRSATHVVFGSDGLDKTLRAFQPGETQERSRYRDLPLRTRAEAFQFLGQLSESKAADLDNLSVARLSWPIGSRIGRWPAWPQEPLSRWQSHAGRERGHEVDGSAVVEFGAPAEAERWGLPAHLGARLRWTGLMLLTAILLWCLVALIVVGLPQSMDGAKAPASIDDLLKANIHPKADTTGSVAKAGVPAESSNKADTDVSSATGKEPAVEEK